MGIKVEKREDIVLVVRRRKDKKYIRKSDEYAHVSLFEYKKELYYKAQMSKYNWSVFFLTEKEAAKAVDIKLIEKGQEPVNILKPKKQQ